jgi:hypothetical protein
MGRRRSLKVTTSPVVESKYVLVHTSRKTYRRLLSIQRQNAMTPTHHAANAATAAQLANGTNPSDTGPDKSDIDTIDLFPDEPPPPVVPNVRQKTPLYPS